MTPAALDASDHGMPWLPYYESRDVFRVPEEFGGGWTAFCCGFVRDFFTTEEAAHAWCWNLAHEVAEMEIDE